MAPETKQAQDRRAFTRVPHNARAVISTGCGEVEATVVDLSVAGLQLKVRSVLDRGEFVRVRLPLSPGDEGSWVDPDALVVRTQPSSTYGCSTVGLSFLALPPAVLQRLSDRVAETLAAEHASNEATSPPNPPAPAADPGAAKPALEKAQPRAKSAPQAAQRDARPSKPSEAPHPAPAPSGHRPASTRSEAGTTPGIAQVLARFFGRRNNAKSPPPGRPAPASPPVAPTSRAELRDLFRSAVSSVKSEDAKRSKR